MTNRISANQSFIKTATHQTPKDGNTCCGDGFYIKETSDYFLCAIADGLGSGEHAKIASDAVIQTAKQNHNLELDDLMMLCNDVTKGTRGAAVALLKFDKRSGHFSYTNVGNIRFYLYAPDGNLTYPLPVKGFLSGRKQKIQVQTFPYKPNSQFLIHTDGLDLKEVRAFFSSRMNIEQLSAQLKAKLSSHKDDVTFILGELQTN
ncbi:PP2C family serine/threonine-protein phosphatase [Priestia flexa]|uniref:PP2C family serine/threonine-protein phosphatase n=1 Tax=Priestia flexa TaxID=86664 RepID=UPI003D2966FA